jgi:hypothetical protein
MVCSHYDEKTHMLIEFIALCLLGRRRSRRDGGLPPYHIRGLVVRDATVAWLQEGARRQRQQQPELVCPRLWRLIQLSEAIDNNSVVKCTVDSKR